MNKQIKVPVHKENVEFPNVFSRTSVINSKNIIIHKYSVAVHHYATTG